MDWNNFQFDKVSWCALAGVPASKFGSAARTFATENPAAMRLFAEECTRLAECRRDFSFKDVVARVRFTHGVKLSNNLAAPLHVLMLRLFSEHFQLGFRHLRSSTRVRHHWTDTHRPMRTLTGISVTAFVGKYGELLSAKDQHARHRLYYDQDLHLMLIQACKDAVVGYESVGATWKVSVKDIIQASRLNYKIKIMRRTGDEREYCPIFSNTDVAYFARMMLMDVPALKALVNGVKRIKHELDKEAELVAPEAFLGV